MPWNLFQETSQGTKNAIHLFCWKFSKKEKTLFLWLPHFLKVTTYLTQLAWWKWGVIILLSPHQTCQTISRNRGSIKVFEWRLGPYSVRKHCGTLQIEMPLLALTWFLMCRPYEIEMYDVEQKYLSLYRLSNHVISNHGNSICNIPQCFRTEHGPRLHSNTWKNASVLPVFLEINWHDWWGGSNTVTPHFHQANGVRWVVTFRKSERKSVFPF